MRVLHNLNATTRSWLTHATPGKGAVFAHQNAREAGFRRDSPRATAGTCATAANGQFGAGWWRLFRSGQRTGDPARDIDVRRSHPQVTPLFVVPCLNEQLHIGPLIRQLKRAQSRLGGIIAIVDGGSEDGTRELVISETSASPDIHLLDNPAKIQSAGINLAIDRFGDRATHLIRIDAHCKYPEDFCDVLLSESAQSGAASVVVSMHAEGTGIVQRVIAAAQNAPVGNGGSQHRLETKGAFVEHGHHALMTVATFREVGGYDPEFTHNEDAELDHRLVEAGYKIWLTGATRITYFPRNGCTPLARQYFNYGSGRARNMLKHLTRPRPRQAKVIAILPLVLLAALAPLHPVFLLPLLLWVGYCGSMAVSLASREKDPTLLLAGPMAMIMHLSWSFGFWTTCLRLPTQFAGRTA